MDKVNNFKIAKSRKRIDARPTLYKEYLQKYQHLIFIRDEIGNIIKIKNKDKF